MHSKRLLTAFLGLSFILTLNTSCDNDRKDFEPEPTLETTDLANTYAANKLIINAEAADETASVIVAMNSKDEAEFKLVNLVDGYPEITFATKLTKKENGSYAFEQVEDLITEDDGISYSFSGSFVGSGDTGIVLVVNYEEIKHLQISDLPKDYRLEKLTINEKSSTSRSVYFKFDRIEGNIAIVSLSYIVPHYGMFLANTGKYAHEITLTKGKELNTFVFSTTVEPDAHRSVNITGILKDGKAHLTTDVKMHSEFVGNWNMSIVKKPWIGTVADIKVSLNTGNAGASAGMSDTDIAASLEVIGGSAISIYMDAIKINLQDDGLARISYALKNKEEEGESKLEELPIALDYVIETDNKGVNSLHLFVETGTLAALEDMLEGTPVKYSVVKSMFTARGPWSYVKIVLEQNATSGATLFKLNEKVLKAIANIAVDALPATQEEMEQIMPGIPVDDLREMCKITAKAKTGSTLGISFKKEAE